jgi:hypothetical protein
MGPAKIVGDYADGLPWSHLRPNTALLATPAGFEPATTRLEGECSIQLSYGAVEFE